MRAGIPKMVQPARVRWILTLLLQGEGRHRYNKPVVGRTRLIKELFLLKMAYGLRDMEYTFVPYWYGPFSPGIYADLQELRQDGLVSGEQSVGGDVLSLTPAGIREAQRYEGAIGAAQLSRIRECKERYNSMPFEDLLSYVYERWPEYTTRALKSAAKTLDELQKESRKAGITQEDVERAIAEYRAQSSSS